MATINCPTTLECPALPRVTLSQAVIDLMESIINLIDFPGLQMLPIIDGILQFFD